MTYADLIGVPFKDNGRDSSGMDCYGVVLEMCRRNGQHLPDLVYENAHVTIDRLGNCVAETGLKEIPESQAGAGNIMQCNYNGELHVGYMLDKNRMIHATASGVRVTLCRVFRQRKYFEVQK
ncbi:MAG: C40 family peptidase [Treponema sp.]|nr:C40 family peptidase [Treponema sp.]